MSEAKLSERVQAMLTPEEKTVLSKLAEAEGRSVSNAARRLILAAIATQQPNGVNHA